MRLTLRTMLAYLDDILDPADARELGQKIEESEFASNLVHRIRNATRRLRLPAPRLSGKGVGVDPNSVAEYLDNTLAQDRVPDFEKVCLESEVHLAEVASCHQILALVLGEPKEVKPELRRRIHGLIEHGVTPAAVEPPVQAANAKAAKAATGAAAMGAAATGEAAVGKADVERNGRKLEVPEYLREEHQQGRRWWFPYAITLVVGFLLAAVGLAAMGPFDRTHPLLGRFLGEPVAQLPAEPGDPLNGDPTDPAQAEPTEPLPSDDITPDVDPDADAGPIPPSEPAADPTGEPVEPIEPASNSTSQPGVAPPGDADRVDPGSTRLEPAEPTDPAPLEPARPALNPAAPLPLPGEPAPDVPMPDVPMPGDPSEPMPIRPAAAADSAAARNVGRFLSEQQMLLRGNPSDGTWIRLSPDAALGVGDALRSLPTYRPQLLLAPGSIKLTFAGPAAAHPGPLDQNGMPRMQLLWGNFTVVTVGQAGAQVRLDLPSRSGVLTFGDAESSAALEVDRYLPPGANPEEDVANNRVLIYCTSGSVVWQEDRGEAQPIASGQRLAGLDAEPLRLQDGGTFPAWIEARTAISPVDREASIGMQPEIDMQRPISLQLLELADHRRVDIRSLAARSLSYLDQYDTALEQLSDRRQKSFWDETFEALRDGITRSPDSAKALRVAMEMKRAEDAELLYRFLWSYSPAQLETGGAESLVKGLEHAAMDVRVLAYENLRRITGGMTQLFRPEDDAEQQRGRVLRWRDRLREGAIVYKVPPAAIPAPVVVPPK